jgi:hypothetical protein
MSNWKKLFHSLLLTTLCLCLGQKLKAQYPVIPAAMEKAADSALNLVQQQSDKTWERIKSVVEQDEKNGKPFVPWASKPEDLPQAKIPAFPGAEGGGAFTTGGRGGKVYVIKTLADSEPGSFREACEQGGARTIVFNVAGIIRLTTPIIIRAPYITISGQTAPGDGVCIAGESVWINTHDVIVTYMRFRRGATEVTRRDDGLGGNPVGNIMIDHVSASWGLDENMSIYRHVYKKEGEKDAKLATVNVTIQNSIFSEGLDTYNHAFGSTIGGHNSTFMRNMWACNIARNPSIGMNEDFNFVNNVIFNWWNRSVDGGDNTSRLNIINNYFKPGPITPKDKPISYRILKPESGRDPANKSVYGKAYVAGNIVEGNEKVTNDNWAGGVQIEDEKEGLGNREAEIRVNQPFPMAQVTTTSAQDAYQFVLANAGATLPKRDAVDERIVRQVKTGKIEYTNAPDAVVKTPWIKRRLPEDSYKMGIITDPKQIGGYPDYRGKPYADTDNDGMPDDWEKAHGLNSKDATDAVKDVDGDGYTNIEAFIFKIDTKKTGNTVTKKD